MSKASTFFQRNSVYAWYVLITILNWIICQDLINKT